jgi:hypothetical protein
MMVLDLKGNVIECPRSQAWICGGFVTATSLNFWYQLFLSAEEKAPSVCVVNFDCVTVTSMKISYNVTPRGISSR